MPNDQGKGRLLPPSFAGIPLQIDNRVPPTQAFLRGPKGIEGVIVNVETYWHLRWPDGTWADFAAQLRNRTLARLSGPTQ